LTRLLAAAAGLTVPVTTLTGVAICSHFGERM
jgi:hypothetical protein